MDDARARLPSVGSIGDTKSTRQRVQGWIQPSHRASGLSKTVYVRDRSESRKVFLRTTVVHCARNRDECSTTKWSEGDPRFGLRSAAALSE